MTKSIIITAGGKGQRMGSKLPKQFLTIKGKPILLYTIEKFYEYDPSIEIILVLPEGRIPFWELLIKDHLFSIPHQLAIGGKTRFHSIKNGLELATGKLIGVHDGVRPFVSIKVIEKVYQAAEEKGAAIPALTLTESIRKLQGTSSVAKNRSDYMSVQTPQCFQSSILKDAYSKGYRDEYTDDATVVEANGGSIVLVEGNHENIKITTPFDLKIAETIV